MSKIVKLVGEFYATIGVPIIYALGLYLLTKQDHDYGITLQITGLTMALAGILMWIRSYKSLGGAFGVLPRTQKRVTKGIYKYLKHPMYVGIILTYLGLSFAGGSTYAFWFTLLLLTPLLIIRAHFESKLLED